MGCGQIDSKERRNVTKFIVRETIKYVLSYPGRSWEYLKNFFDLNMNEFNEIVHFFRDLNTREKNRGNSKPKKNYANAINQIIMDDTYHLLFNKSLENMLDNFAQKKYSRIEKQNMEVYHNTIKLLYHHSCEILKKDFSHFFYIPKVELNEDKEPDDQSTFKIEHEKFGNQLDINISDSLYENPS